MNIDEVNKLLYTPLDVPTQPSVSIEEIKAWLADTYTQQNVNITSQLDSGGVNECEQAVKEQYPWNLTLAYLNMYNTGPGWINGFNRKFPELAYWIYTSFGLNLDDVGSVIMLPVRDTHIGQGFWHNDPEPYGVRFYLEFEEPEYNKLLMRQLKQPYKYRRDFDPPVDIMEVSRDPTMECKLLHNKQSFFLNNVRAIHSTWTEIPNKTRIACFVTSKVSNHNEFLEKITALALRSAKKYPDHAIWWKD